MKKYIVALVICLSGPLFAYRFDVAGESIVISGDLTYSNTLPILTKGPTYLIMNSGGTVGAGAPKNTSRKSNSTIRPNAKEKAHVILTKVQEWRRKPM